MIIDYSHLGTKDKAFKQARKDLGIKRKFKFNGKTYTTDTADDISSPLYELIPDDDNKYKIDIIKNRAYLFEDNDWSELENKDNYLVPKSKNH